MKDISSPVERQDIVNNCVRWSAMFSALVFCDSEIPVRPTEHVIACKRMKVS